MFLWQFIGCYRSTRLLSIVGMRSSCRCGVYLIDTFPLFTHRSCLHFFGLPHLLDGIRGCLDQIVSILHGWSGRTQIDRDRWSKGYEMWLERRDGDRIFCCQWALGYGCTFEQCRILLGSGSMTILRSIQSGWIRKCLFPGSGLSKFIWIKYRFHDPDSPITPLELLQKYRVFRRQIIGKRGEVIPISLHSFPLLIQPLLKSLNILGQKILPTDLIPIPKMINTLIRKQSHLIQSLIKKLFLAPINIPILLLRFFIPSFDHSTRDAVIEVCFELYLWAGLL